MDRFEKLAKDTGAKVIIQHEPRDIACSRPSPKRRSRCARSSATSPAGPIRCGWRSCPIRKPGRARLLVRVRACGDQFSRRADHRGQVSAEAAAPVRAGRRDCRRGRGGRRRRRRLECRRSVIAVTGFGGLAEKVVIPAQVGLPAAGRAQLRGRRGAAPDLCDVDPRLARSRAAAGRADPAGARRGRRRRSGRGRARQGLSARA